MALDRNDKRTTRGRHNSPSHHCRVHLGRERTICVETTEVPVVKVAKVSAHEEVARHILNLQGHVELRVQRINEMNGKRRFKRETKGEKNVLLKSQLRGKGERNENPCKIEGGR